MYLATNIDGMYLTAATDRSANLASMLDRIEARNQLITRDRKITLLVDECSLMKMTLDRDIRVA